MLGGGGFGNRFAVGGCTRAERACAPHCDGLKMNFAYIRSCCKSLK